MNQSTLDFTSELGFDENLEDWEARWWRAWTNAVWPNLAQYCQ